jgi:GT2 family glycosyltransferase
LKAIANLTVAVATLNRPDGLARCLDALLGGEVLPEEIIIVDQGQDNKARFVVEQRRGSGVPMIYIQQARRGLSVSRNAAFAHSTYPFVAVTDDDCVPDQGWVSTIKKTFSSTTVPDAMTGRILPLGQDTPGLFAVSSRVSTVPTEFRGKVVPWVVGSGGNFAAKREWFDRVGGYDERLGTGSPGMAAEDADFIYRLLRAGASIKYEPEAVMFHERQSKARRLSSCWSYGYGIGAFCGIWFCQGDFFALRALGGWLCWQGWYLITAAGRRQWMVAYQRLLSLRGTARGLVYGLLVR